MPHLTYSEVWAEQAREREDALTDSTEQGANPAVQQRDIGPDESPT